MILVTVGTHNKSFNRLLKSLDKIVETRIKERVIAQIGHSTYIPRNYKSFNFTSSEKMIELTKEADIVITHAGAGAIITALKFNKPTIVVPRQKRFNEHTDDHQLQLTKELEKQKKVIAVYNIKNLEKAIQEAKKIKRKIINKKLKKESEIFQIIREYLQDLEKNN